MDTNLTIYVQLIGEGTIVYRPTTGVKVTNEYYRLLATYDYDPENEHWEFTPGTIVKCEMKELSIGKVLVALENIPEIAIT